MNGQRREHEGTDGQFKQRIGNPKKELKRNAREKKKKNVTEMKNGLHGLIRRLDMAEEKSSELEDVLIRIPNNRKPKRKRLEK